MTFIAWIVKDKRKIRQFTFVISMVPNWQFCKIHSTNRFGCLLILLATDPSGVQWWKTGHTINPSDCDLAVKQPWNPSKKNDIKSWATKARNWSAHPISTQTESATSPCQWCLKNQGSAKLREPVQLMPFYLDWIHNLHVLKHEWFYFSLISFLFIGDLVNLPW